MTRDMKFEGSKAPTSWCFIFEHGNYSLACLFVEKYINLRLAVGFVNVCTRDGLFNEIVIG